MSSTCLRFWGKTRSHFHTLCYHKLYSHKLLQPPEKIKNDNNRFLKIYNYHTSTMTPPTIYRDVNTVLDILKNHKADNVEAVTSLLEIYNNALKSYKEKHDAKPKMYPLIILEGLDGSGKSTVGMRLASKLNAKKWCTPPESIKHIRHLFDDHIELRSAYYALGNYIAALEVAVILKESPVVMDRYWHSTAAFAIAQAVHDFPGEIEMPPEGDTFYHWPDDLLKPDAVLFLNVREDIRLQRISRRTTNTDQEELLKSSEDFRNNIILAYKNMVNPEVIFVNGNGSFNSVLREIDIKTKHLFNK